MFDVLMYLFETYIHTEAELRVDQDKLEQDLTDAGFDREDIYNALLWLEKLADYQEGLAEPMQLASDPLSMRIYTPEECERLDASCRGFLLFLEQIQVLNLETREMVIERVLALDTAEFDLEDLKWVILMVLFNIPGCENAYQQMEELLFEASKSNSSICWYAFSQPGILNNTIRITHFRSSRSNSAVSSASTRSITISRVSRLST